MTEKGGKTGAKKKAGRPSRTFTREEIDAALQLLGQEYYASRVVGRLQERFSHLGRDLCYRLVDEAKKQAVSDLTDATGSSPMVTIYLGLCALAFGEKVKDQVKVQALAGMTKLLGVKAIRDLTETGDVEKFLREIGLRQQARLAEQATPTALLPTATTEPTA